MSREPKVLTLADFAPMRAVETHLRRHGVLPGMTACPLRTCQESQAQTGKRRCEIDLPVCAWCHAIGKKS